MAKLIIDLSINWCLFRDIENFAQNHLQESNNQKKIEYPTINTHFIKLRRTLYILSTLVWGSTCVLVYNEISDLEDLYASPKSDSFASIIGTLIMMCAHLLNLYLSGPIFRKDDQSRISTAVMVSISSQNKEKTETYSSSPMSRASEPLNVEIPPIVNSRDRDPSCDISGHGGQEMISSSTPMTFYIMEEPDDMFVK